MISRMAVMMTPIMFTSFEVFLQSGQDDINMFEQKQFTPKGARMTSMFRVLAAGPCADKHEQTGSRPMTSKQGTTSSALHTVSAYPNLSQCAPILCTPPCVGVLQPLYPTRCDESPTRYLILLQGTLPSVQMPCPHVRVPHLRDLIGRICFDGSCVSSWKMVTCVQQENRNKACFKWGRHVEALSYVHTN